MIWKFRNFAKLPHKHQLQDYIINLVYSETRRCHRSQKSGHITSYLTYFMKAAVLESLPFRTLARI